MEKRNTWKCYLGAPAGHLGMQNTNVNTNYGTLGDDTSATVGICSYIQCQQSASVAGGTAIWDNDAFGKPMLQVQPQPNP